MVDSTCFIWVQAKELRDIRKILRSRRRPLHGEQLLDAHDRHRDIGVHLLPNRPLGASDPFVSSRLRG